MRAYEFIIAIYRAMWKVEIKALRAITVSTILKKTAKRTIVRKAKRKLRSNFIDTVAPDSSILDCGHCDDGYLSD